MRIFCCFITVREGHRIGLGGHRGGRRGGRGGLRRCSCVVYILSFLLRESGTWVEGRRIGPDEHCRSRRGRRCDLKRCGLCVFVFVLGGVWSVGIGG